MKTERNGLIGHSRKGGYVIQRKSKGIWKAVSVSKSVPGRSVMYSAFTLVYGTLETAQKQFEHELEGLEDRREHWAKNFNAPFHGGVRIVGIKSGKIYDCKEY